MARFVLIAFLLAGGAAWADRPALDDARLGASAAAIHATLDGAARAGLPADLMADKVQEGLAKGVPAARIAAVVAGLADSLGRARAEAQPLVGAAISPALLKAIVEAHAAGAGSADVATVLGRGGRERAVQVLTDLLQRGYPVAVAARTVAAVQARNAGALDRVVGEAERLRTVDGAAPGDALDALARANAQGLGLNHAEQLLHRGADASDDGNGPNRETSGVRGPRSGGVAAPGKAKGH
ncbi:MAG TPA: hypothetical protein VF945_12525 [Polyangia bacterium]